MKNIFLHILKTAGTSLRWTIRENYSSDEIYEKDQTGFDWKSLTVEQQQKIKMIYGHLFFGVHEQVEEPCKYVTFLRDPVDRVMSYYYYVLSDKNNPGYKDLEGLGLDEFVLRGNQDIASNQQTKILCGSNEVFSFDLACKNIEEHFSLVGVVEEYRKSLKLLGKQLGWKNVVVHELNRSPNKLAVPQHVREVIENANQIDRKLYDWVLERFEKQYANG